MSVNLPRLERDVKEMLRSDFVIKLMSVVLFIAVAAYIGLYIFDKANKPLETTAAVRYTVEDSGSVEGYIIRNETVLTGGGSTVTLLAGEGEKLASGQAVAVYYEGETALERASEIRTLQLEIKEAETDAALSGEQLETDAEEGVFALSDAVQHKDLSHLEDLTFSIKKAIFTSSIKKPSEADLAAMKDRLSSLLSQSTDNTTVYAPVSGVFSSVVDGLESIGPEKLKGMTPSSLQTLYSTAQSTGEPALGKMITGITWYYAAIMDKSDADRLQAIIDKAEAGELIAGPVAVVQFTKTYNAKLNMKIESVGTEEDGKCVVIFSAKRGISDMTALRSLTAQVEFSSLTGLLVPKEAVYHGSHVTRDKTHIFLLTGLQAEKVYIDILIDNGDSYIVKDGMENKTVLREGSQIILKAEDLYDGKVVGR
jgi:hypothetical protein